MIKYFSNFRNRFNRFPFPFAGLAMMPAVSHIENNVNNNETLLQQQGKQISVVIFKQCRRHVHIKFFFCMFDFFVSHKSASFQTNQRTLR